VEEGGGTDFPVGSRVMFTGPYGVFEDGADSEWLPYGRKSLCRIHEGIDDVRPQVFQSRILPRIWLSARWVFQAGKMCWRRRIGGSGPEKKRIGGQTIMPDFIRPAAVKIRIAQHIGLHTSGTRIRPCWGN